MTSPVAFNRPASARLTPVFPPHLPQTGVRRPAARPTHRPSHHRGPPRRTPWPSPPAPPGWPDAAWRGRAGRWRRLAVDTCRSTNPVSRGSGKGWGRGVAKSMNGHYEVAYEGIPLGKRGCGRLLGRGGPSRGGSCVGCASQYQGAVKETPRGLSRLDFRVPELCPVWRRWGGSCPRATPRRGVQGQDEALHRLGGLTLVGLWGPRPWVPPYPGPT